MKILIDSSIWLEYFAGGVKAKAIEKFFKPPNKIVLPAIVAYEVYKKIKAEKGERMAMLLLAQMERISDLMLSIDQGAAVQAADISLRCKLPMADSMIYASAMYAEAILITMDFHFKDMPSCQFVT